MEDLSQEDKLKAMRQYVESRRKSELEQQMDWDQRRLMFKNAYDELIKQGAPKDKLQPYMLKFLEKEAEMNNRMNFIPEEQQKEKQTGDIWI